MEATTIDRFLCLGSELLCPMSLSLAPQTGDVLCNIQSLIAAYQGCCLLLTYGVKKTPLLLRPSARSLWSPGSPWILTVEGCSRPFASWTMTATLAESMNSGNTTTRGYQLRICT